MKLVVLPLHPPHGTLLQHLILRGHYGPDKGDITVPATEPHPEDKKRGARIKISAIPAGVKKKED